MAENPGGKKKFKLGCIGTIIVVIVVFVIGLGVGVAIGGSSSATTVSATTNSTSNSTNTNTTASSTTSTSQVTATKPVTLTSGNYTAGKSFPAGTYTVEAISGYGNVSSSNMYAGGLNQIMAPAGTQDSSAISTYKNAKFPAGTTLTVSDVTIKLIPSN